MIELDLFSFALGVAGTLTVLWLIRYERDKDREFARTHQAKRGS